MSPSVFKSYTWPLSFGFPIKISCAFFPNTCGPHSHLDNSPYFNHPINIWSGFGGLVVSMLASGTQDRGFDPGRSRRIFRVKNSTPCLPWWGSKAVSHVADLRGMSKNPGFTWKSKSQAKFRLSLIEISHVACTWRHLEAKVGTCKGGGKQWQPTPKKLPRMQCARAIPVA